MKAVIGTVNENLKSTVPVDVMRDDYEWKQFSLLLDTGFNEDIALRPGLLDQYRLGTDPSRKRRTPAHVLENYDFWWQDPPYKVELRWRGRQGRAGLHLLKPKPTCPPGLLGTKQLKHYRVTVDAIEGGIITIDSGLSLCRKGIWGWRPRGRGPQIPCEEFPEDYRKWSNLYLSWTGLKVQDSAGEWHSILANVDTGNFTGLSLPTAWVTKLGLRLPGKVKINTKEGSIVVDKGEVQVIWQGKERPVECIHQDDYPPIIGMKLLKGYKVTMDFNMPRTAAEIRPLLRPISSLGNFFDSLAHRLRS